MANIIDENGLTTMTQAELVEYFTTQFKAIYGNDINLDSETPDGQMMMIFIQAVLDILDLATQVFTSMNPDMATGRVLDQRVAYNGIQRQAGTHTITEVEVTTIQSVSLPGADQTVVPSFKVSDNAGNEFELVESISLPVAGTHTLVFQSVEPGAVLTVPNTITVPVSIVLGVESVNNPNVYTTLGIDEETDAELRIRRQRSVSIAAQGYYGSLLAALENISDVTSAFVFENNTDDTDDDDIPSHSIWVIVSGGEPEDIANAIYQKRNAGCGMKGDETYTVTQVDGTPFVVRWDNVEQEDLYIKFDATSINGEDPVDVDSILDQLPGLLDPGVYERLNINDLATLVQQIDENCLVTNAGFGLSNVGPWSNTIVPSAKNKQFAVAAERIDITEL